LAVLDRNFAPVLASIDAMSLPIIAASPVADTHVFHDTTPALEQQHQEMSHPQTNGHRIVEPQPLTQPHAQSQAQAGAFEHPPPPTPDLSRYTPIPPLTSPHPAFTSPQLDYEKGEGDEERTYFTTQTQTLALPLPSPSFQHQEQSPIRGVSADANRKGSGATSASIGAVSSGAERAGSRQGMGSRQGSASAPSRLGSVTRRFSLLTAGKDKKSYRERKNGQPGIGTLNEDS